MSIVWNDHTMSTGDAEIDAQHKVLITRINELFDFMRQGRGTEGLPGLLDFLGNYARLHFAHEEACMNRNRCPAAASNKAAHAEFMTIFGTIRRRLETEGANARLVIEAQQQLSSWITQHIVRTDTQLRPCLRH